MRIVGSGDKEIWWVRGYNGRVGQDGMGIGQLGRALGSRREGRGPSLRVLSLPFHSCPSIPLCPGSRFRFCYGFQSQTVNYFTSTEPCFSNTSIFPRPAPCLCLMPLRVSREKCTLLFVTNVPSIMEELFQGKNCGGRGKC